MIPGQLAFGIAALLVAMIGVIHWRLEMKMKQIRELERSLEDARRELLSMETLKSRFLGRIGDVLAEPLKAIESTSEKLGRENPVLPDAVLRDLSRLSEEVHSLVRILTVFEQISREDGEEDDSPRKVREGIELDRMVSEAVMDFAEEAADRLVSVSVNISGQGTVHGNPSQLSEAVASLLQEALRRADPNTVLTVELRAVGNVELELGWTGESAPRAGDENILGTGLTRLIASSHGGWLSEDWNQGRITLILPRKDDSG